MKFAPLIPKCCQVAGGWVGIGSGTGTLIFLSEAKKIWRNLMAKYGDVPRFL